MEALHILVDQEATEKRPKQNWVVTLKAALEQPVLAEPALCSKDPQSPRTAENQESKILACGEHFISYLKLQLS